MTVELLDRTELETPTEAIIPALGETALTPEAMLTDKRISLDEIGQGMLERYFYTDAARAAAEAGRQARQQ